MYNVRDSSIIYEVYIFPKNQIPGESARWFSEQLFE